MKLRYLLAGTLLACVVSCGGGSGAGSEPTAAPRPLGPLRELSLLAGSVNVGSCHRGALDGTGAAAAFGTPGPMAIDSSGVLDVLEIDGLIVRRVTPEGVVTTVSQGLGGPPVEEGGGIRFFSALPVIAIGPDGSRYRAAIRDIRFPPGYNPQPSGWVIFRIPPGNQAAVLFADPLRQAQPLTSGTQITAMALDSQGRLLVADTQACSVRRVEKDGRVTPVFAALVPPPAESCYGINALAIDSNDELAYALSDGSIRRRNAAGIERIVSGLVTGTGVSLTFDAAGRLIVSDRSGKRLLAVLADGSFITLAASAGGAERPELLSAPSGVVADRAGTIFVADAGNCTVNRIDPSGRMTTLAGLAPQNGYRDGLRDQARIGSGFRIAADASGTVFVADPQNRVIRRITAAGLVSTWAGTPDPSAYDGDFRVPQESDIFSVPSALAISSDGGLTVADLPLSRRVNSNGVVTRTSSGPVGPAQIGLPNEFLLASAPNGELYSAQGMYSGSGRGPGPSTFSVWRWPATGLPIKVFDQSSAAVLRQGDLLYHVPKGLAVASNGDIYFTLGHAVFRSNASGTVLKVAGSLEGNVFNGDHRDGSSDIARFNFPSGLALDRASEGVLYVADTVNHVIRKITATGEVSTVVGRPKQAATELGAAPGGLNAPREVWVVPGGLLISTAAALLVAKD